MTERSFLGVFCVTVTHVFVVLLKFCQDDDSCALGFGEFAGL